MSKLKCQMNVKTLMTKIKLVILNEVKDPRIKHEILRFAQNDVRI